LNGRPDASAGSEMHDRVHFFAAKHSSHRVALSKIDVTNVYVFCKTSNIRVLDLRIVKIIEIVQDDDFMTHGEQLLGKMRPDKASTACDYDSHGAQLATDKHGWTQILHLPSLWGVSVNPENHSGLTQTPYNQKLRQCSSK
jgi:hypothetical protein